ncbi:MAG: hypothetical protein JWP01_3307 [Myxococcales bacterium]|nr:hypothetical protein [Myxococcales bacterium]
MSVAAAAARNEAVPTEFRYWDHRAIAKRILGFDPAPPDDVVRMLAAMYYDADPDCEAFIDEVYLAHGSAAGRAMLERALAGGAITGGCAFVTHPRSRGTLRAWAASCTG